MFMWMFIEGLYLHNVVTVTVFQGRFPHTIYAIVGWGSPFMLTVVWAIITIKYKVNQRWVCFSIAILLCVVLTSDPFLFQMSVGIQLDALLLDSRRTKISCNIGECTVHLNEFLY